MTSKLIGRVFTHKELTIIMNKLIKNENISSDLSDGNFHSFIGERDGTINFQCEGPYFCCEIKTELFTKYAKGLGKEPTCGNCNHFKKIRGKEGKLGTCIWTPGSHAWFPFWFKLNIPDPVSSNHRGCECFYLKDTL